MGIGNCTECGKLCLKTPRGLCPSCQQAIYEAEEKVVKYLYDFPNSTIEQVHDSTKVAKHIIIRMIRTGRIIEGTVICHCESCNAAITSGRVCEKCASNLVVEPQKETVNKEADNGGTVYYNHSRRPI